jgi:hypothetical protein
LECETASIPKYTINPFLHRSNSTRKINHHNRNTKNICHLCRVVCWGCDHFRKVFCKLFCSSSVVCWRTSCRSCTSCRFCLQFGLCSGSLCCPLVPLLGDQRRRGTVTAGCAPLALAQLRPPLALLLVALQIRHCLRYERWVG